MSYNNYKKLFTVLISVLFLFCLLDQRIFIHSLEITPKVLEILHDTSSKWDIFSVTSRNYKIIHEVDMSL